MPLLLTFERDVGLYLAFELTALGLRLEADAARPQAEEHGIRFNDLKLTRIRKLGLESCLVWLQDQKGRKCVVDECRPTMVDEELTFS